MLYMNSVIQTWTNLQQLQIVPYSAEAVMKGRVDRMWSQIISNNTALTLAAHNIKTVGGFFRALNLKLSIPSLTLASSGLEKHMN